MPSNDVTFQFWPAVVSGALSGFIVLVCIFAMLAMRPVRFPLNPLYLVGSAFSIDTTAAYLWGLALLLFAGAAYGVVIGAVFTGFELDSLRPIWGAVTGLVLSIVSGTTFAYSRSLNRSVRNGYVGDPGPFLVSYGRATVVQFLVAHGLFGLLAGTFYTIMA